MKRSIVYVPVTCLLPLVDVPLSGTTCVRRAGPSCAVATPGSIRAQRIVAAATARRVLDMQFLPYED